VSRTDESRLLPSRAMYCYIKERRKRGRPPKKWIDNIKEDVKLMELSIGEAVKLTRDREKRRSLVATSSSAVGWRKREEERWHATTEMTSFLESWYTAFSFSGWYSNSDVVKTVGPRGNINAIWLNIKINLQILVDICGYELPINLQNFTQKDLTEVIIFPKVLGWLLFWNTLYFWGSYNWLLSYSNC